jgi:hypothetical protein
LKSPLVLSHQLKDEKAKAIKKEKNIIIFGLEEKGNESNTATNDKA